MSPRLLFLHPLVMACRADALPRWEKSFAESAGSQTARCSSFCICRKPAENFLGAVFRWGNSRLSIDKNCAWKVHSAPSFSMESYGLLCVRSVSKKSSRSFAKRMDKAERYIPYASDTRDAGSARFSIIAVTGTDRISIRSPEDCLKWASGELKSGLLGIHWYSSFCLFNWATSLPGNIIRIMLFRSIRQTFERVR